MRKLGEQWIEAGRMYKAVSSTDVCDGCHYLDTSVYPHERTCGECKTGTDELIVKDLGPVNKDGCLACPFCGGYMMPVDNRSFRWYICASCDAESGIGNTPQEARDNCNRRHA